MKLYFLNGSRSGERLELSGREISIGRETDNDVVIETAGVSRYHAKLTTDSAGDWLIKDLGSTNGSKVNKIPVEGEKLLAEGDTITLGDQNFRITELKAVSGNASPAAVIPVVDSAPAEKSEQAGTQPAVKKIVFEPLPKKTAPPVSASPPEPVAGETGKKSSAAAETDSGAKTIPVITVKDLSEGAADIFGASRKTVKTGRKTSALPAGKQLFNILFYLVLLVGVAGFVFWFLSSRRDGKKTVGITVTAEKEIPLVLDYVKEVVAKDNVFRFSLLIENHTATFAIDDLKSDRHYNKVIEEVKPEFLKSLRTAVENTGFMTLPPVSFGSAVNNLDTTRKLAIALNNRYNSIVIRNNSAPTSFEDIEGAIEDFADGYDLLTFAMTPEELQKRAKASFVRAEEYYANRNANSANLLEAERRYKLTIDYLDQFSPKPEIWKIARKRYAEVEALRKKRWTELLYEVERLERLDKLKEAVEVLNEMILLAPEGSKAYKWARLRINRLSEAARERKK
ncbi:MAG: FHA domain-containing protein [Victivallaceae bacterium]|nr:FHA domain-containing protein [Victivallaceae bacterium]